MNYISIYKHKIDIFVKVCAKLSRERYVTGNGGNLAWKLEDDLILISPTQLNKGDITEADVTFITTQGVKVEGEREPSGETPMHLNFFKERPDITSVIHCHPSWTNSFAISKEENWLMHPIFPETTTEVGPVPLVPYAEPLTQDLADNFLPFIRKYNAFLMENHGLVVMSPLDIEWTFQLVELLEMSSLSIVQALKLGSIKELSKEDLMNLDNLMKTRNLPMFGAPGLNESLVDLYFPDSSQDRILDKRQTHSIA